MKQLQSRDYGFVLITVLLLIGVVLILGLSALRDSRLAIQVAANDQFYTAAVNLADSVTSKYIVEYNRRLLNGLSVGSKNQLICFNNDQFSRRDITKDERVNPSLNLDDLQCADADTTTELLNSIPIAKAIILEQGCQISCTGFSL